MTTAVAPTPVKPKKKLVRRHDSDRSQWLRRGFQAVFLGLNVWISVQFILFVRFYESGGRTMWADRPAGVEGWLPIASLMNLKILAATGHVPHIHPAGTFILIAFLAIAWLFRKIFCSWLCPIGTVSEYLWRLGKQTFGRNFRLHRRADIPLRSLKYILLGLFAYAVCAMPVPALRAFLEGPYGVVADVKMLNFFRYLTVAGAATLAALLLLSVLVQNFWCRYLCPYGALLGLASWFSPLRIRRKPELCIDCSKCAKACPSALPVDKLIAIQSVECTGCLECVAVCPAEGALCMSAPRRKAVPVWGMAVGIAVLFLGICGWAQWRGYWRTEVSSQTYFELIPHAREFTHP